MPTTALSSALKSKQKAGKLSIAALSKAIGVNVQSVTGVLKGKSSPNATTAPKYAKFLGLSAEKFAELVKPGVTGKAATTGKATKVTKFAQAKPSRKVAKSKKSKPAQPRTSISLAEAVELSQDALAVATYRATAAQRKVIAAVLAN